MLIETFRSQVIYRSLDAAMTASLRPRRSLGAEIGTLLGLRSANYDRMASFVNTLDRIVPGTAKGVTRLICRPIVPPFPADTVELLAFGSGATVFRARSAAGDKVIKFYRRSFGADSRRLPEIVDLFRRKYELVSGWYADVPGVVWPAEFGVLAGPIFGRPAAICIQSFIEGQMKDFFTAFTADELVALMEEWEPLREEFLGFARATIEIHAAQGRCVDFLGDNNLTIVFGGERPRLHLIDYGSFDFGDAHPRNQAARLRIEAGLEKIGALANRFLPKSRRLEETRCELYA